VIGLLIAACVAAAQPAPQPPQVIREIRVHGNATIPDTEVIRLSGVATGTTLTDGTVKAVEQRLRESGRFDEVQVLTRYRTLEMTDVALVLIVHEKPGLTADGEPPSTIRRIRNRLMFFPILGYEDGYGWTYGLRTTVAGSPSNGTRLSMPLSWGGERRAAVEAERSFSTGPLTRILGSFGTTRRETPHLDVGDRRTGLTARAERRIMQRVTLGVDASRERVTFGGPSDMVWTTGADAAFDTRNDPGYPSDAVLVRARWSRLHGVGNAYGGTDGVDRYGLDLRGYKRLFGTTVFAARAMYDTASGPLPRYDEYLVGGALVRGTHAGALAGDRRFLWSTELRLPFTSPLTSARTGVNVFLDGGTAAPYGQSLRHAPMERGAGAGLFLVAAVVRLNLDVAHSLDGHGTRVQFGTGFTF
jgi:outer membrane protein assembly factor BamA